MRYSAKVGVLGAGISGLVCAYRLKQAGGSLLLFDAASRPGGILHSVRRNSFLIETGPQAPRFAESIWSIVRELGLDAEFLPGDPKAARFIVRNSRLESAPFSPGGLLSTHLLDFRSKLRLFGEVFSTAHPPADEETLAAFVERKFGPDVLDYLVDPIVSTVFFGDARKMGMESAFPALVAWERESGSLVRGALRSWRKKRASQKRASSSPNIRVTDALPSLGSFRSGIAALPERIAATLVPELRLGASVESIVPLPPPDSGWHIRLASGEAFCFESIVLALPAFAAASLLRESAPGLSALLASIEYAPFCAVSTGYARAQVAHPLRGFGFMVPRRERAESICTFWNSSLFPGRAPKGHVLLTTFAGREATSPLFSVPEDECSRLIERENARYLGIAGDPVERHVWRSPRALPQYNVGHARCVAAIRAALRSLPGLHLAGNYLEGRSIGECAQLAARIAAELHSPAAG